EEGVALLRAHHEVEAPAGLSRDQLCSIIGDFDALVVRSQVQVDAGLIEAGKRLTVIGRAGVGVDNVDLDAATRAGIVVVNAPTGNTIAAAEHPLALLHVPLTRSTRRLIGAREIGLMKPTALLLNVARGGIVDEAAVAAALREGRLAGAAVDVFEHEPPFDPDSASPLLDAPNTLLTPHLGASTAEAQVRVAEEVAQQIVDVLAGRSARYAVNAPLLTPETAQAIAPYLPLAEVLGRFFGQFCRTGVRTLTIEVAGELATHDMATLTAAALRGLLEIVTTERVNLVNAASLARARGLTIVEHKTPEAGAFASLITLSGEVG